jgi:Pectate lyase superfamily protein
MRNFRFISALTIMVLSALPALGQSGGVFSVRDFGAEGDGKTDDTGPFQKALDAAGKAGGGTVMAERGNYFFAGHLHIPRAVTLSGMWNSVPSHVGIRSQGFPKPTDDGTTFLVTESEGKEDGPGFLTLSDNSTISGVVFYYPLQKDDQEPKAYPWTIVMRGENPAVLEVELLNSYNGIDASQNERHMIRNVSGQPLRRGVYVDSIYDIGRIENVHFNPWWSSKSAVIEWQRANGEAFIFGRDDWQYVLNTFCYGYKIGYKFIRTPSGVCNGNFLGIGADDCDTSVVVEDSARFGLLINNGEFTSIHGPDPTMVEVGPKNSGSVRFSNCAFWGPCNQIAKIDGKGTTGFSECTFCFWDNCKEDRAALQVKNGSVLVNACEFQVNKPQVDLGADVKRAVIADNLMTGKLRVTNRGSRQFQIHDNAAE